MTKQDQQAIYNYFVLPGILYHPELARVFHSKNAAILLGQLLYWQGHGKRPTAWIYKSAKQLELETALSNYQVSEAVKILERFKVIKTSLKGTAPMTRHFWVDMQVLRNLLIRLQETDKLNVYKPADKIDSNQATHTKNTHRKSKANNEGLNKWF